MDVAATVVVALITLVTGFLTGWLLRGRAEEQEALDFIEAAADWPREAE